MNQLLCDLVVLDFWSRVRKRKSCGDRISGGVRNGPVQAPIAAWLALLPCCKLRHALLLQVGSNCLCDPFHWEIFEGIW